MKKLFTTIWNKFISIFKSKKNNPSETKQFVKVFAKKIENDFVVIDAMNNEILKETIHPVVSRKERFSSYQKTEIIINNSPILLTEKQIIFYKIILELTEEFGKARAKDICIRYVTKLNKKDSEPKTSDWLVSHQDTPEWLYKLSAHNKTMKFLLKSGIVFKVNKGYKAIK